MTTKRSLLLALPDGNNVSISATLPGSHDWTPDQARAIAAFDRAMLAVADAFQPNNK